MRSVNSRVLIGLSALLSACGGGGGNDASPPPDPTIFVTISGHATFGLVPIHDGGSGLPSLDYDAIEARPVRGVTVQALTSDASSVLAATITDEDGEFRLDVPTNSTVVLRARAELASANGGGWSARVADNMQENALYVLETSPFDSGTSDSVVDLHAETGWTGSSYGETRSAAPFAILDAVYDGMRFLLAVDPSLDFAPLTLHWSPENRAVAGADGLPDPATGEIVTSFYSPGLGGIFLLGKEDDDTEEYDRGVILHEWGHYIEDEFSRSDSIGGPHTIGDQLDMRVAFSEGFASALAGMVLGDGLIEDTFGSGQGSGFTIDVENPIGLNPGWYSEESVQGILFDLFDSTPVEDGLSIGFSPLLDVLTNEHRNSVALTGLFPFVTALKIRRGQIESLMIDDLLFQQDIASITDEYGTSRANPAPPEDADVLPIYTDIIINGGPVQDICSTDDFGDSLIEIESVNKLGSRRFLKFAVAVPGDHTFTVTATTIPDGDTADPDIELHRRGALLPATPEPGELQPPGKSGDPDVEVLTWPLTAGDHVLEVYEWTNTNARDDPNFPPIGRTCFDVEITRP